MTNSIGHQPSGKSFIHYAQAFPVDETACGLTRVPASGSWKYVDCEKCLAKKVENETDT